MFFSEILVGQSRISENLSVESNYFHGFILPEYQFINFVVEDNSQSLEINLLKETTGKNTWEQVYGYPTYGLSFLYSTLGNDSILGKEFAITPFLRIPLLNKKNFGIFTQLGLGASYVTKKFDFEDNFLNVAVGSHFNFHFNTRVGFNYQLNEQLKINSGLSLDHFSNANTAEPNLGINYLSGFLGLSYRLQPPTSKITSEIPNNKAVTENELVLSVGGKHARSLSSKYYFTSSVSFEKRKSFWRALHLGIGADLFYDTSIEDQLTEENEEFKNFYNFQTGIHISQNIIYGRFSLTLQEGIYLGLTERIENYVMYNRGIFKYFVTENVSVRLTMKSHLHILDYPEIGLGIKL